MPFEPSELVPEGCFWDVFLAEVSRNLVFLRANPVIEEDLHPAYHTEFRFFALYGKLLAVLCGF